MRRIGAVAIVYAAAAVSITWPLVTGLGARLGAPEGAGDPFLNLWVLGWGLHNWRSDPLGTLAGGAFDAPIFHPAPLTLTYSDHQLPQALAAVPIHAVTGDLTVTYNLLLLGSLAASGAAMHALARAVTGSTAAAFVAGLAWACWPYRTAHLLHLQLQALYFLPLVLLLLLRVAAGRRWRDAAALGGLAAAQALVSVYYGIMTAALLMVAAPVVAWTTGQWRAPRYWSRVLAAGVLAALLLGPVLVPYRRAQAAEGFGRNLYEAAHHAAALQSYTQVPPDNLLYGRTGWLAPRPPGPGERDRRHVEHQMFPGAVLLLLGAAGLATGWRSDRRPAVAAAALLAAIGVWLSAGPEGPFGVYAWLARQVFAFEAIRAPARFAVVAMLGLCLLAAIGMSRVMTAASAWPPRRRLALATVVTMLMVAEYVNAPLSFAEAPPTDTPVGRWLRDAPEPGAVVYWPVGLDRENTPLMLEGLQHGRPIVNGYSGQRPSAYTAIAEALSTLPAVEGRAMLRELDIRFIVAPQSWPGAAFGEPFVPRAVLGDRAIYEVRWSPDAEAALAESLPPPPPPGPIPFAAGELAQYEVRWVGELPAGTITIGVAAAGAADRLAAPDVAWRFEASAQTAEWVSRFFEARDQFVTLATDRLVPRVHRRDIDEGAREQTRAYLYDDAAGQVLVGASEEDARGDDGTALPLVAGARDTLSALFYARTLAWEPGGRLVIPVNDAGRNLSVRLEVEGRERVRGPGGLVDADRARVTIERRLQRRQPIAATIWLTRDAKRVPVRLEVSAGFGALRVELVDYRP